VLVEHLDFFTNDPFGIRQLLVEQKDIATRGNFYTYRIEYLNGNCGIIVREMRSSDSDVFIDRLPIRIPGQPLPRMMLSPLKNVRTLHDDALKELFDEVAQDVLSAKIHFEMFKEIRQSTTTHLAELNCASTFWSATMGSHQTTAWAALSRVYDPSTDALTLPSLMDLIRTRCTFPEPDMRKDRRQVSESDPIVKKFIWHRNKIFAHKDLKEYLEDLEKEENRILETEFEILLARAGDTLNKYNNHMRSHSNGWELSIHDELRSILNAVRTVNKARKDKYEAEIAAWQNKAGKNKADG
jgi:hypothetical protein